MTAEPAAAVIARLGLMRHDEGGWFRETYRAPASLNCPDRDGGTRALMTVIHYLMEQAAPRGLLHRNRSDIVHFHQGGGVLRYVTLDGDGLLAEHLVGPGHLSQLTVPGGVWKATELVHGPWALVGEAVSPGFDYRDRDLARPSAIRAGHPAHAAALAPFLAPEEARA